MDMLVLLLRCVGFMCVADVCVADVCVAEMLRCVGFKANTKCITTGGGDPKYKCSPACTGRLDVVSWHLPINTKRGHPAIYQYSKCSRVLTSWSKVS